MNSRSHRSPESPDAGFGLIEIVVSMFLLALLAVSFLPLLITSLQSTVRTSTVATASQLVSQQLDEVRAVGPYCEALSALSAFDGTAAAPVTDARGTSYQPHREVGTCPTAAGYPAVVPVTVWLTQDGGAAKLSLTRTLVYVQTFAVPTP